MAKNIQHAYPIHGSDQGLHYARQVCVRVCVCGGGDSEVFSFHTMPSPRGMSLKFKINGGQPHPNAAEPMRPPLPPTPWQRP